MKLIINTTTLKATGVTQASISFINECKKFSENEYFVFMSKTISNQIKTSDFPNNFHFFTFDSHPLYGLAGFRTLNKLKNLEKIIKPDFVFSVFGPSIWTPKAQHLMGFAVSFFVYPKSIFFNQIYNL